MGSQRITLISYENSVKHHCLKYENGQYFLLDAQKQDVLRYLRCARKDDYRPLGVVLFIYCDTCYLIGNTIPFLIFFNFNRMFLDHKV